MPAQRDELLTTLREQCRAPNSLADSRHQARLVSDRRARTPVACQASPPASDMPSSNLLPVMRDAGGPRTICRVAPIRLAPRARDAVRRALVNHGSPIRLSGWHTDC